MTPAPAPAPNRRSRPGGFLAAYGDGLPAAADLSFDQQKFINQGQHHRERGVRGFTGPQTEAGLATVLSEVIAHLTGAYGFAWPGRRLPGPLTCWFASDDPFAAREDALSLLLGQREIIPRPLVVWAGPQPGSGVTDTIVLRHINGGESQLLFRQVHWLEFGRAFPVPQPSVYGRPVYADLMEQTSAIMGRGIGLVCVHWLGRTAELAEFDHTFSALRFQDHGGDLRPRITNVSDWPPWADLRPRRY